MTRLSGFLWFGVALFLFTVLACSSDSKKTEDAVVDQTADESSAQDAADDSVDEDLDTSVEMPKCLDVEDAADRFVLEGLSGPVEVVLDQWGVPHIYASSEEDLFMAQGFVVARYRIVQMHAMRAISSGRYGESLLAGAGDVSNDVYMRVLGLRRTAQKMWEDIDANHPKLKAMLEAYAQGVNTYLAAVADGTIKASAELGLMGELWEWTPVDSLLIGRLQSWDLSFGGRSDKIGNFERLTEYQQRWAGGELDGLYWDLHPYKPMTDAVAVPENLQERKAVKIQHPNLPEFLKIPAPWMQHVQNTLQEVPLHKYVTSPRDVGSNNWTVAGAFTAASQSIVANDTHLSLSNPPVFFEIHMDTTRSGGDLDLAGVTFPGIPSIILGRNAHAAWGGTVYYADVTDIYIEQYTPGEPATVLFEDEQVEVEVLTESMHYGLPEGGCEAYIGSFIQGLDYTLEEVDGKCELTVDIEIVPHHGPIIPGSKMEKEDGSVVAMSWRWTGFEPSNELAAVYGLMRAYNPEDFLGALEKFRVGAQNWVFGDNEGNIAYAAYCRIPQRPHLTAPNDTPAFLPYDGTGCCEWGDDVAIADLPQSVNPPKGYIITANADALGHTLDGDPYNDETYQGYSFDLGFRAGRINELMEEKLAFGAVTVEDMQEIQADAHSPMGARLTPHILEALEAAQTDEPGILEGMATPQLLAAGEKLSAWSFTAASGVGDDASEAEKQDAIATSIFNVWLVFVIEELLDNKFGTGFDMQFTAKFLVNLYEAPQSLLTYDADLGDSKVWDNPETEDVETRHSITLFALKRAIDFLSNPEQVGIPENGGFGTDDMEQWLWGELHTVKLTHPLGGSAAIPPESEFPNGYPRHGDNFSVDSANPGFTDTNFMFYSGPAIRNVFDMKEDGVESHTIIPGGQDGAVFTPHYADLMPLWAENETHPLHQDEASVLEVFESCFILNSP